MSKHTLTHADRFLAGNAVVFNLGDDYPNSLRGLPIKLMVHEIFGAGVSDPDGISTAQTYSSGGQQEVDLNGAFVDSDGIAQMPYCGQVELTAAGADAARTFTVLGFDANGRPMAEEMPGANAGSVTSNKNFCTVTRIFVDADTAGDISFGQNQAGPRGLRAKSEDFVQFYIAVEDGAIEANGSWDTGSNAAQTATNNDQRAAYTPVIEDDDIEIMYLADFTKEGIGENYTDSSQRVPSAI